MKKDDNGATESAKGKSAAKAKGSAKKKELWQVIDERIKKKRGRPPRFKTPTELWRAATDYFAWADDNPIDVSEKVASGTKKGLKGTEKKSNNEKTTNRTPYSLYSFQAHAGISNWTEFKKTEQYQTPKFLTVIRAIENVIAGKQIDGAIAGVYQHNIVARLNGLAEKSDITSNGEPINNVSVSFPEVMKGVEKVTEEELFG